MHLPSYVDLSYLLKNRGVTRSSRGSTSANDFGQRRNITQFWNAVMDKGVETHAKFFCSFGQAHPGWGNPTFLQSPISLWCGHLANLCPPFFEKIHNLFRSIVHPYTCNCGVIIGFIRPHLRFLIDSADRIGTYLRLLVFSRYKYSSIMGLKVA